MTDSPEIPHPATPARRRFSIPVDVGGVTVGGNAPIVVQSMTNTSTPDVDGTVAQITELYAAGSELVRITVNTEAAAVAVPEINARLKADGLEVPIIGDFHFNGHLLLKKFPECAEALAKYRINPGNVGRGRSHDNNFRAMIIAATEREKPVRIGVNWGSLDQDMLARMLDENQHRGEPLPLPEIQKQAIIRSALDSAAMAMSYGLENNKILLSAKVSDVQTLIDVYTRLADACEFALHLGLTEAGMGDKGLVATSAALAVLLQRGIGDTIRYSLTPQPGGDRAAEVRACQYLLQSLGFRNFLPLVTACPGCGRTTSTYFQELAERVQSHIRTSMPRWKQSFPGVEFMNVAVMGCVVNGPGESKHADIGISLPGDLEEPKSMVYIDGEQTHVLSGENIVERFTAILDDYVEQRYGAATARS